MKSAMRCVVLFTACALSSACSDKDTSPSKKQETKAPASMESKGKPSSAPAADLTALTSGSPTPPPSLVHTAALQAPVPAAVAEPPMDADQAATGTFGDDDKKPKPEGLDYDRELDPAEVKVDRFILTSGVEGKEPIDDRDVFTTHDPKIFAFVQLANDQAPFAFRVHWEKLDEQPSPYGVKLTVPTAPRYRTWSWTAIKRSPGQYKAVLRTLDGKDIASREFVIEHGEDCLD